MAIRGVILAGGKGTRMGELTKVTNKHLLPVGPWPMVYHPLKKLVGAGLSEILLVSGTEHMGDFVELLGSGKDHGCRLTYRVQDEAGGIAQALGLANSSAPAAGPACSSATTSSATRSSRSSKRRTAAPTGRGSV